jgi:hemerythrin-like domain-containing protein
MEPYDRLSRRSFIATASLFASAPFVGVLPINSLAENKNASQIGVKEVSPVEDLMREHGGLNRILLIYDEAIRRLRAREEVDPNLLKRSAQLIRDFIEGYHEKLEEEHIFPRLKKAGRLVDTLGTLQIQHRAGRKLTETIIHLSTSSHFKNSDDIKTLESALSRFIDMYRPHEAREDTVVFPEFKKKITLKEYDQLGELFEDREHELFGKEGFDGIIAKISELEKALGLYDLSKFTPTP